MLRWLTGVVWLTVSGLVWPVLAAESAPASRPSPKAVPSGSAYAMPNNYFGAHLLVTDGAPGTRGHQHLRWARHLVGQWGYAKTFFYNIDKRTTAPAEGWIDYVKTCYELELIPVIRLGGAVGKGGWLKPEAEAPGDYGLMARAVKAVVSKLPRSDLCPLYIELWNEPNLAHEWSGQPDAREYADFLVQCAAAIRSIRDERIKILNGGLVAASAEWARRLGEANPGFIKAFDVWAAHPYPLNHPPSVNFHNKTVPADTNLTIDSYVLELEQLSRFGRGDIKVMITETGYDLGNSTYTLGGGYPIINEWNRTDYIVRAFRDWWSKWPEVVAVLPFEFCNASWGRFDWVYPDSDSKPDGSPTRPHYQYTAVAALAKPTDKTGAISGTVTVAGIGTPLQEARVTAGVATTGYQTDPLGNYFLAKLPPGPHRITISKPGFSTVKQKLEVERGRNTVFDATLQAEEHAALRGTVTDDDGKPLTGVEITLEPGTRRTQTDRRGEYEFPQCIPAQYKLVATASGRHRYEAPAVDVVAGKPNRLDFVLGPRKAPDAENMLANPSMEAGGGGGGQPGIALSFEPADPKAYNDRLAKISDYRAHTGRLSQQLQVRPQELVIRQITPYSTARLGVTYLAGMWIYADIPDRDGAAWISLDLTRNDGSVIHHLEPKARVKGQSRRWTWLSVEGAAPSAAERLVLNLHTRGRSGFACFDDAYVGAVAKGR